MSSHHFSAALALTLFLACLAAPALAATPDELIWRGDHATGRAIMDDLAKEYAKEKKGKIVLQPFSTLSGLDAVAQGSADIAGSARGKYARRAEEAGINFVPVALDAAVPIAYPKNPVSSLTLTQIHDIYYGRITNWKELGGNDAPINLYAIAAPLDGVEFSLRELVFHNGDQRVAAPRLYLNTTKLEEAVALDPAGLGLSTLASVQANKAVKMLGVEGIGASIATVTDATYPLYITLFLAERDDSPKHEAVNRFIAFLDTPIAKDILRRHALVPYADASDVIAHNTMRVAFIDAHLGRDTGSGVALAAATPAPTPVSAPRATLEAKTRIAPTAESTEAARENLARAEEKAAARKAAMAKAATPSQATAANAAASGKVVVASHPKKASTPPATPKIAKSTSPKAVAKKKPVATAKAAAPAKRTVSFGNVSSGATGG